LPIPGFTAGENTAAKLAQSTPRKPGENGESQHSGIRHFLRARFYHSTKFRLPAHFVLWESCWGCHPKPAFCGLRRLKKSTHERRFTAMKRYNTPHRHRVIKTRLTEEEYAEFSERVTLCKMSQAEFIRQALIKSSIRPVITVSPVNDELLSAVGKLTAEYGKIGGNLNQIARCLNEYGAPYNALSQEVRAATAELAALKFEVLQKVGEAVGNIQTYQL
jgi:hypothetical protein